MPRSQEVIELIEQSVWDVGCEGIGFSDIYDSASDKKTLPQLYSLYADIKPAGSKLKSNYHWANLKSSIQEDLQAHIELEAELTGKYISYLAHFAKKHLILEEIDSSSLKNDFNGYNFATDLQWSPERTNLINNKTPEATISPMRVVSHQQDAAGNISFLLQESVEGFYYANPPSAFLSETGREFQSSMRLKQRVVMTGFNKVIINADFNLRVILIDPSTLVGSETATDKAMAAVSAIRSVVAKPSKYEETKSPVAFFPAVKRIYEDGSVGQVVGGYFYTSSGGRYIHNSKGSGSDLRKDPFQQGGELASATEPINFIKIDVEWAQAPGKPYINLNGSADMFERPDISLHSMEVGFSTASGGAAAFLKKPLDYGKWK
jgi:hypothetical protein